MKTPEKKLNDSSQTESFSLSETSGDSTKKPICLVPDSVDYQEKTSANETVSLIFDCYFEGDTLYFVEDKSNSQNLNENRTTKKLPKIDKQKISSKVRTLRKAKSKKQSLSQVDLTGEAEKGSKRKRVRVSFPQNHSSKKVKYAADAQLYAPYTSNAQRQKNDCDVIVLSDDEEEVEPVVELLSSDDEASDYASLLLLNQQPKNSSSNSMSTSTPLSTSQMKFPQHPSERNKNQINAINSIQKHKGCESNRNDNKTDSDSVKSSEKGHSEDLIESTKNDDSRENSSTDPTGVRMDHNDISSVENDKKGHSDDLIDTSPKTVFKDDSIDPIDALIDIMDNEDSSANADQGNCNKNTENEKDLEKSEPKEVVIDENEISNETKSQNSSSLDPVSVLLEEYDKGLTLDSTKQNENMAASITTNLIDESILNKDQIAEAAAAVNTSCIEDIPNKRTENSYVNLSNGTKNTIDAPEQTCKADKEDNANLKTSENDNNKTDNEGIKNVSNKIYENTKEQKSTVVKEKQPPDDKNHRNDKPKDNTNKKKKPRNCHMFMSTGSFLNTMLFNSAGDKTPDKKNNKKIDRNTIQENLNQGNAKETAMKVDNDTNNKDSMLNEGQNTKECSLEPVSTSATEANVDKTSHTDIEMDNTTEFNKHETSVDATFRIAYENLEKPTCIAGSITEFQTSHENYLRDCKWSPDGEALLTNSNDNILRIFSLPENINDQMIYQEMSPNLRLSEGETVYCVDWYPYMNLNHPEFCCFLSTSRDHPIHLWDSVRGKVRCSYRAFDQMDELTSANSVAFNLDGSKIYSGFNKMLRIFDSNRPGRECEEISTVVSKNRSKKGRLKHSRFAQTGIISSIGFSAQYNGLYALGSYNKTVGLYSSRTNEAFGLLSGHKGGITQVKFTNDGFYLFTGGRKDPEINCWDLRDTSRPLFQLSRKVTTNQTIHFDIDLAGSHIISGDTQKNINVWNLDEIFPFVGEDVVCHQPKYRFQGHHDVVNAASIHPTLPILASSSGQRHFIVDDSDSDDTDNIHPSRRKYSIDNCLKLWKL